MKIFFTVIIIIAVALSVCLIYSLCVAAGKARTQESKDMEQEKMIRDDCQKKEKNNV